MKGQAAMEFLMTYGWAILVVLAAIAALAYFGVLNPDRFLPEKCTLPSGLACLDWRSTGTGFDVNIENSFGFDINTIAVSVSGAGCTTNATGPTNLVNGDAGTYSFTCAPSPGQYKGDLTVSYANQATGLSHDKTGVIILTIL